MIAYLLTKTKLPYELPLFGYYPSPDMAVLVNPQGNFRILKCKFDIQGIENTYMLEEVTPPTYTTEQRIGFALKCMDYVDNTDVFTLASRAVANNDPLAAARAIKVTAHTLGTSLGGTARSVLTAFNVI